MARAPFQVLVLPYRSAADGDFEFALFQRADDGAWQGIAGGGEEGESPLDAARREAREEAGIPAASPFFPLDSVASVPVTCFRDSVLWGEHLYVIPEHAFGVDATDLELVLSGEHAQMCWLPCAQAELLLRYDSNRVALWELNRRIRGLGPRD
jgi:dATP pyrophosphohydrolase